MRCKLPLVNLRGGICAPTLGTLECHWKVCASVEFPTKSPRSLTFLMEFKQFGTDCHEGKFFFPLCIIKYDHAGYKYITA